MRAVFTLRALRRLNGPASLPLLHAMTLKLNAPKLKNSLELATNLAVIALALALLVTFVASSFWGSKPPQARPGLERGQGLKPPEGLDYGAAPRTVLVAISPECGYCTESLTFYRELIASSRRARRPVRFVAIVPENDERTGQYLAQNQLDFDQVLSANFDELKVPGTPTVIETDDSGHVVDFWMGRLSAEAEQQIFKALSLEGANASS